MNRSDPYDPTGEYLYECWECGGTVKNLAVPRE